MRELREKVDAPLPPAPARNRLADVVNPTVVQADAAITLPAAPTPTPAPAPLPSRLPARPAFKRKSR